MSPVFNWYFLSLKGRISRQEFWLGYFGLSFLSVLLSRTFQEFVFYRRETVVYYTNKSDRDDLLFALVVPSLIAAAIIIWPLIAIFVKRLHDANLSGWWLLATLAIPIISAALQLNPVVTVAITHAIIGLLKGSKGNNRFGMAPPGRSTSS